MERCRGRAAHCAPDGEIGRGPGSLPEAIGMGDHQYGEGLR